ILCDSDGAYWINSSESPFVKQFTDWTLNNTVATNVIHQLGSSSGRVEIEDIPSAREFLPIVAQAMSKNHMVVFTYAGFARSRPEVGILFAPYFLKRYKQGLFMFGVMGGGGLRTYALDRVTEMEVTPTKFKMPRGMTMATYFGNIVGITSSKAPTREVVIQTSATRAKYLRALPLHNTQREEAYDFYSIFRYRLKINYELVSELMAMGPDVTVIAPRELRLMLLDRLRCTMANYQQLELGGM
ncbi:MAG: WYL domain-containing protein, partial [Muribaculaceae bacterium]|nr:WYL domain-containing protein [Muribaculaceae bacterium]